MKRNVNLFLVDIFESIKKIENYTNKISSCAEFSKSDLIIDGVIRNLEVIGEAAKNIPDSFRNKYPEVPWRDISGLRDKLSYAYFGVELNRVWNIIEKDIKKLKEQIKEICDEEGCDKEL